MKNSEHYFVCAKKMARLGSMEVALHYLRRAIKERDAGR